MQIELGIIRMSALIDLEKILQKKSAPKSIYFVCIQPELSLCCEGEGPEDALRKIWLALQTVAG